MANNDMAIVNERKKMPAGKWVDERLAALQADSRWQPDTMQALSRLRRRLGAKASRALSWCQLGRGRS
jgi:hypothetical protein